MPTSLRVGYVDYAVEDWPAAQANSSERFAECDRMNLVIRLRTDLPKTMVAQLLLHETLHAAFDMGDLNGADTEEKIVTVLSLQLSQIVRDNPELVAYLQEALK